MRGARRRAPARPVKPSATAARSAASEIAAMRQSLVALPCAAAAGCGVRLAVPGVAVAGVTPYGPFTSAVSTGPVTGVTPYGPFTAAVDTGVVTDVTPYGPFAPAVDGGPVTAVTPYGPRGWGGSVPGDATAPAGAARHSAQTLPTMRRMTMVPPEVLRTGRASTGRQVVRHVTLDADPVAHPARPTLRNYRCPISACVTSARPRRRRPRHSITPGGDSRTANMPGRPMERTAHARETSDRSLTRSRRAPPPHNDTGAPSLPDAAAAFSSSPPLPEARAQRRRPNLLW